MRVPQLSIGPLDDSYARLPEHFFSRLDPVPVAKPHLIRLNRRLAAELALDLDAHRDDALAALFSGNVLPEGAEPIAMAYAGHQFGHFVPQLGDGRALLLGEVRDRQSQRRDLQLKGSGRTPFSRGGDGRAALGPMLREYLVSEAMHALGIPSTRALAVVATGETLVRDGIVPGAVLTRVAASHVRVGTFQYFAARNETDAIRQLADYVLNRHFADAGETRDRYQTLLQGVVERQALLVARWMSIGFIHGVMNTDNMAVSGETIDYGPCAFMDAYDPDKVFSSIDRAGRYAYGNQPLAAQWNLARFAETLLPLLDVTPERAVERATEVLNSFLPRYQDHWLALMRRKLGIVDARADDLKLVQSLLAIMHANQADFTLTFRGLGDADTRKLFADAAAYDAWEDQWRSRQNSARQSPEQCEQSMRSVNPAYIPRNHRIEQVIRAAVDQGDFVPFVHLLEALEKPYEAQQRFSAYALPPQPGERVTKTFCGT